MGEEFNGKNCASARREHTHNYQGRPGSVHVELARNPAELLSNVPGDSSGLCPEGFKIAAVVKNSSGSGFHCLTPAAEWAKGPT